jgi:heme/copper-type cytochrome/quinol oxidase subunit 3
MNEMLGHLHFWGSFISINLVFFPMFIEGLAGMNRRMYDGGAQYAHNADVLHWNVVQGYASWALGLAQLFFIVNFFMSIKWGKAVDRNPWEATDARVVCAVAARTRQLRDRAGGLSWTVRVQRSGRRERLHAHLRTGEGVMNIPYTVEERPDSGLTNGKFGIWLFLASEVMLFGALFSTYIILRQGSVEWPHGELNVWLGMANTVHPDRIVGHDGDVVGELQDGQLQQGRMFLLMTFVLAGIFLVNKYFEYADHFARGEGPSHSTFLAIYYTLTGLHGLHIIGGMVVMAVPVGARHRICGSETPSSTPDASNIPGCTGTSSTWCGSSCSRFFICYRETTCRIPLLTFRRASKSI